MYTSTVMDDKKAPVEWGAAYQAMLDEYRAFATVLGDLTSHLLQEAGIDVAQLECRTKTVASFVEKIIRKNKYRAPLQDVTDLVGVRIIVYDPADCAAVDQLIRDEFTVDDSNSPKWSVENEPERFGYLSQHYVVSLTKVRCDLSEYRNFAKFKAEIQVRTVMQHAWAAVDHKIRYKAPDLPPHLRRRLLRLSALVDMADEEFGALLLGGQRQEEAYEQSVSQGEYGVGLDALSLSAFLETTGLDYLWAENAVAIGYIHPTFDQLDTTVLLRTMEALHMRELRAFQEMLTQADSWGNRGLERVLAVTLAGRAPQDQAAGILARRDDVLNILLLLHGQSHEAVDLSPFRFDIKEAIRQVLRT
jgi:putative GTP pyrophosphokinase